MATIAEFIQCDSRNYTAGRGGTSIDRIVVHYTGTSASAHNNLLYFSRSSAAASAHYFIDKDGTIRQSVKESDRAWHAGNWAMNCRSIGIEVVSAGEDFTSAQITALAALIADIKSRYSIGDVVRHYDVTGKRCPAPYVNNSKWNTLKAQITGGTVSKTTGTKAVEEVAKEVIAGKWGNGDARKTALQNAGYDYATVQAKVNELCGSSKKTATKSVSEVAQEVINGKWGNGDTRKKKLEAAGYSYSEVQAKVNELLGASSVDIDQLARDVIAGKYGNGDARKKALGSNYTAVQKRVNEMLS